MRPRPITLARSVRVQNPDKYNCWSPYVASLVCSLGTSTQYGRLVAILLQMKLQMYTKNQYGQRVMSETSNWLRPVFIYNCCITPTSLLVMFSLTNHRTLQPFDFSAEALMLRTPNVITDKLMTTAYIRLQINSIAVTSKKMTMLLASAALISFETHSKPPQCCLIRKPQCLFCPYVTKICCSSQYTC